MRTRLFAASVALLTLLSASMLVTAGDTKKGDAGKGNGEGKSADKGKDGTGGGGGKTTGIRRGNSVLTGMYVRDKQGDAIGRVSDIVVDMQSGKVIYFAVGIGGVVGFNQQLHAVAPNAMHLAQGQTGNEFFMYDLDVNELRNAKGFDSNNWPSEPKWSKGKQGSDGGSAKEDLKDAGEAVKEKVQDIGKEVKEGLGGKKKSQPVRISAIVGMDVYTKDGKNDLGDVYDVAIDPNQWHIIYAAVSHGGQAGGAVGGKLYAVDWKLLGMESLTGRPQAQVFTLDVTADAFNRAKGFTSNDVWPRNPDQAFSGKGGGGNGKGGDNGKGGKGGGDNKEKD